MEILKDKIHPRLLLVLQMAIIITCGIFIYSGFSTSSLNSSRSDLLHTMTLETQEALSQQCMDMLEEIKVLLDAGNIDAISDYRCPLHNEPYVITYEGDAIVVDDPDPQLHGFLRMGVSSKNPDLILVN